MSFGAISVFVLDDTRIATQLLHKAADQSNGKNALKATGQTVFLQAADDVKSLPAVMVGSRQEP